MESHLSPKFKAWMKKCLDDEFSKVIENHVSAGLEPYDVAQKIINSREMTELTNTIRNSFVEQIETSRITTRQNSAFTSAANSRPQTSLSYVSDLSGDEWSLKGSIDEIGQIVDQMGVDKPDHVRLAGYEALLETDLSNISSNNSWNALLKALRDGIIDGSRSVFEASMLIHAKLLNFSQYYDAYVNLLNAFTELNQSKKLSDTLPTILSGVNFKIFLHEKLFRVMRLILDHHEEILKGIRTTDKFVEDMMEQFISFLCSSLTSIQKKKVLSTLHILSNIEPQAGWSKKWMHSFITRKTLCSAISKSPSLIQNVVACVKKGLENLPTSISVTISNEPCEVYISGESIETFTFLHCLNLLIQLCSFSTGRTLLLETQTEESFSIPDFLTSLLSSLNILASSQAPNGLYETMRIALSSLLKTSVQVLYDARFYQVTLSPLVQSEIRMWPHTIDVLIHLLDTSDGPNFLITEHRITSASLESKKPNYPVLTILNYSSNILRQPIAVMSIEHVVRLFKFIEKLFTFHEIFYVVEEVVRERFYPSVNYLYTKLDKYYVENENKTHRLSSAVKDMLLNIVSVPLGLQMLSNEPLVFEELIRESIAPVRASWSAFNVVSFISNSGFLSHGTEILSSLAPHVLTTLLVELSKVLEDPERFHDPWESDDARVFLHVLAIFSLNTQCFKTFMKKDIEQEEEEEEKKEYITNLCELFEQFMNIDSPYHQLGLLSLKVLLWNLDIYIYLNNLLNFQKKFLKFQDFEVYVNEDEVEQKGVFIVSESSLLRNTILLNCYYVRHKRNEDHLSVPEETRLFSKMPPPEGLDDHFLPRSSSDTELTSWLRDCGPGLRDGNWVAQTKKAHKASPTPMKSTVILDLLDQMEQAIPTVEWTDHFEWDKNLTCNDDYWTPEDKRGIDLVYHYSKINGLVEESNKKFKSDLKTFIQSAHSFITYKKSKTFEGFDWFLATVFLICNGQLEKAKNFVTQILRFPSAIFIWPALAKVVDESNDEEASTKLLFAHLLESIISLEYPTIKFALKNECGIDWWMICDKLLTQCFWGILPWSEIIHFFAICILHTPDYVLYYCASLLVHCENDMMKNIMKGKMWPEDMILEDYRCHSQIGYMDRLGKRYGGKVLPPLSQRKLSYHDNINSANENDE